MKRFSVFLLCAMLCINGIAQKVNRLAEKAIDLSGEWEFMIDRNDQGERMGWFNPEVKYNDRIVLPGSMAERGKGDDVTVKTQWVGALYDSSYYFNPFMEKYRVVPGGETMVNGRKVTGTAKPGDIKLPFFLTPKKHYIGKAWYRKTINISENRELQNWSLFLERPHIISKVWINGKPLTPDNGKNNSLSIPHSWAVKNLLKTGENTIVICIDNDPEKVNVGKDSHSVTDQTQGCWNGIVGKMELRRLNPVCRATVYTDIDTRKATVKVLMNGFEKSEEAVVTLVAESFNTAKRHIVASKPVKIKLQETQNVLQDIVLDMGDDMLLWDEFCPQLYRLTTEVKTKSCTYYHETYFGMRKIEIKDKMFYVNGKEILLRGNVENCLFPNTGYPPTDLDSWITLFETYKKWGVNHVRFHSYCPPENAFLAADMVGLYIQPEGPSWPNHGVKLGRGEFIDTYLMDEAKSICDEYGNHPSFTFFAFGNEPAGNWVKWCNDKMPEIKEYDPRHIYAGFSVGGGWAWQPKAEFAVKAGARGLAEWVRTAPESMTDFSDKISVYNGKDMPGTPITVPFVTHEMGQWCVFPNFSEIKKYTGVNKAANFEIFRDLLRENGMESRERDFLMASGKLQTLCYKYEIERILRTPKYAGFQILSLNDYSGQGSALVGVTDAFYGEKGYVTAPEFREFCSRIVPLAKFKKFTYSNNETFEADIQLSQYGNQNDNDKKKTYKAHWEIKREPVKQGPVMLLNEIAPVAEGDIVIADEVMNGKGLFDIGHISVPLQGMSESAKYTLTVTVPDTEARNHWDFWVYNTTSSQDYSNVIADAKEGKKAKKGQIYVTDTLDSKAMKVLKKGGKVLICAAGKVSYGKEVVQQFLPCFWNTSWFKMRPPHTTGVYIEQAHPVFEKFSTDYHSDLQWWELVNRAQVMQFTDFPSDFQPLVQSIDTWFVSRKIGMLFEAKVGKGRLMMTSMDINNNLDKRLVARELRQSIINYMLQDEKFQPQFSIDAERISDLFTKVAGEVNMYTNDSPDELKPKLK